MFWICATGALFWRQEHCFVDRSMVCRHEHCFVDRSIALAAGALFCPSLTGASFLAAGALLCRQEHGLQERRSGGLAGRTRQQQQRFGGPASRKRRQVQRFRRRHGEGLRRPARGAREHVSFPPRPMALRCAYLELASLHNTSNLQRKVEAPARQAKEK